MEHWDGLAGGIALCGNLHVWIKGHLDGSLLATSAALHGLSFEVTIVISHPLFCIHVGVIIV